MMAKISAKNREVLSKERQHNFNVNLDPKTNIKIQAMESAVQLLNKLMLEKSCFD